MILLYGFLLVYTLWIFYLAVMNLKRVKESKGLTKEAKFLGVPTLIVGLIIDNIANNTVFALLFLDATNDVKELVTGRLKRYVAGQEGWRKKQAQWWARALLDDFDPSGRHV
jgi:hypothetical protein